MEDLSISDTQSGQLPEASQKATAVVQATQSSRTLIKGVGKTLGQSITAYTRLMVDIAVHHLSVPQVTEITGGALKEKYRKFVLPNRTSKGKRVGKVLRFNPDLVGAEMNDEEKKMANIKLAEESGYPDTKSDIIEMNPEFAPRLKYLISFDPEEMFINNQQQMQIMLQNMYAQLAADPMVDHETLLREYFYAFFRSKGDDFIAKQMPVPSPLGQTDNPNSAVKMPTPVSPVGV
jgi:ribosomal protein S13